MRDTELDNIFGDAVRVARDLMSGHPDGVRKDAVISRLRQWIQNGRQDRLVEMISTRKSGDLFQKMIEMRVLFRRVRHSTVRYVACAPFIQKSLHHGR